MPRSMLVWFWTLGYLSSYMTLSSYFAVLEKTQATYEDSKFPILLLSARHVSIIRREANEIVRGYDEPLDTMSVGVSKWM